MNTNANDKETSNDQDRNSEEITPKNLPDEALIDFIDLIFSNNRAYSHKHGYKYFEAFADKQSPRATVIICSDSRVQTAVFDGNHSVNEFFIIRNIGNQIETARGSVEFGIRHLHTPVLMIVGHSGCGAIEAALKDFSNLSPDIQKELKSLKLPQDNLISPIKFNVHHQVEEALEMFDDLIENKKLIILGFIYDFRNDFKQGYGSLILVNLNGEQNIDKIKSSPYLKKNDHVPIGVVSE